MRGLTTALTLAGALAACAILAHFALASLSRGTGSAAGWAAGTCAACHG